MSGNTEFGKYLKRMQANPPKTEEERKKQIQSIIDNYQRMVLGENPYGVTGMWLGTQAKQPRRKNRQS